MGSGTKEYRRVNCPECWAKPGKPCRGKNGRYMSTVHEARKKRARAKLGVDNPDAGKKEKRPTRRDAWGTGRR